MSRGRRWMATWASAGIAVAVLGCVTSSARRHLVTSSSALVAHGLVSATVDEAGTLIVKGGPGYVATQETYTDVEVKVRVRARGNSGVFVRGRHGLLAGVTFPAGVEAQIDHDGAPWSTGALYGVAASTTSPPAPDAWFDLCVAVKGPEAVTAINGARSARATVALGEGFVAWQGHDPFSEARFANLHIRALSEKDALEDACRRP